MYVGVGVVYQPERLREIRDILYLCFRALVQQNRSIHHVRLILGQLEYILGHPIDTLFDDFSVRVNEDRGG